MTTTVQTPLSVYLTSIGVLTSSTSGIWQMPLQQFTSGVSEQLVNVSIENNAYILYFQNNVIENNLFLSCYGINQNPIYFGSFRCVFGSYINFNDNPNNPLPYLIYFIDTTQNNYTNITFDSLNNGVNLYFKNRTS